MKKQLMIIPLVFLLCFVFGCQKGEELAEEPVVDIEADVEAIKTFFAPYSSLVASGDLDGFMALFTEDVIFLPLNLPVCEGKEACRQWGQPLFDQLNMEETLSLKEIEVSGDWAFVRNSYALKYTPKAGGETVQQNGKAIWILKRQTDGSWKSSHCIWNSDHPAPPPLEKK